MSLQVGITVGDPVSTPYNLDVSDAFLTLNNIPMRVGLSDQPATLGQVTSEAGVQVWKDQATSQDPTKLPICVLPMQLVLTAEEQANVYQIMYTALKAQYKVTTDVLAA